MDEVKIITCDNCGEQIADAIVKECHICMTKFCPDCAKFEIGKDDLGNPLCFECARG